MYLIDKHWPCIPSSMLAFQFKFFSLGRSGGMIIYTKEIEDKIPWGCLMRRVVWYDHPHRSFAPESLNIYRYTYVWVYVFWWIYFIAHHMWWLRGIKMRWEVRASYIYYHIEFFLLCGIRAGIFFTYPSLNKNEIPQYKNAYVYLPPNEYMPWKHFHHHPWNRLSTIHRAEETTSHTQSRLL